MRVQIASYIRISALLGLLFTPAQPPVSLGGARSPCRDSTASPDSSATAKVAQPANTPPSALTISAEVHMSSIEQTAVSTEDRQDLQAGARRDPERAKHAARERVATAQMVSDAVSSYHDAADRIDDAHRQTREATQERSAALTVMRSCGLTVAEISDLTGMSSSRVQTLLRTSATV